MTEHDRIRKERAERCNRADLESVRDAVRGLQSTDDPSLVPLHDDLFEVMKNLERQVVADAARRGYSGT